MLCVHYTSSSSTNVTSSQSRAENWLITKVSGPCARFLRTTKVLFFTRKSTLTSPYPYIDEQVAGYGGIQFFALEGADAGFSIHALG